MKKHKNKKEIINEFRKFIKISYISLIVVIIFSFFPDVYGFITTGKAIGYIHSNLFIIVLLIFSLIINLKLFKLLFELLAFEKIDDENI